MKRDVTPAGDVIKPAYYKAPRAAPVGCELAWKGLTRPCDASALHVTHRRLSRPNTPCPHADRHVREGRKKEYREGWKGRRGTTTREYPRGVINGCNACEM